MFLTTFQADDFQHHYLIFLLLVILSCFDTNSASTDKSETQLSVTKMVLIQTSIIYIWATIAKLDPLWFDGTVFKTVPSPYFKSFVAQGAELLHVNEDLLWSFCSIMTCIVETYLAFAIHVKQLHRSTFFLGILLHIVMGLCGISIGLFSVYMIVIYTCVMPPGLEKLAIYCKEKVTSWIDLSDQNGRISWGGFFLCLIIGNFTLIYVIPFYTPVVTCAVVSTLMTVISAITHR